MRALASVEVCRGQMVAGGGKPDRTMIDAQTEGDSAVVDKIVTELAIQEQERQIRATVQNKIGKGMF